MGKMKWYATMEDNLQQPILRKNTTQNRQRRQNALGHWIDNQQDPVTIRSLFRQIVWRLRRHWLAFLFQANRFTLGAFRERTALKLGTILGMGYFLLFSEQKTDFFLPGQLSESMQLGPVKTAIEDSDMPTSGRSLEWKVTNEPTSGTSVEPALPKLKKSSNGAAPISAKQMGGDLTNQYIRRFSKTAVQEMHKFGIPASISLAQGLVESRYGTSTLAVRNNNHFGMKCFSKKCRNGHCSNFGDDHHKDFFRIFKTPWDSWRAHSLMLANGRYTRLKKFGKNYRQWAHGLENLGYATDRSYAEKLIGVIERYNLQQFDRK